MKVRASLHTPRAALVVGYRRVPRAGRVRELVELRLDARPRGKRASTTAAPTTLHIAFGADMQVPDPDIFYELEGNAVTTSVYEGLIRYKPDSNTVRGRARDEVDGLARRQDLHVHAAPEREVPRRDHDGLDRGREELPATHGGELVARVHARRRRVVRDAEPADLRREAEESREPVPRLPRGAVRAQGRQSHGDRGARRYRPRAVVAEVARRRHRSVHDLVVRARPEVRAHGVRRLLGTRSRTCGRSTSRSSRASRRRSSTSRTVSST